MKTALLFTDNATIKKLFSLSLEKINMKLIEDDINNPQKEADVIFIDNSVYSNELMQKLPNSKKVLILGKNEEKKPGFDNYMLKPFLPTDLIELIQNMKTSQENKNEEELNIDDDILSDDLNLEEDLNNLGLDDDLNFEKDDIDLNLDDDFSIDNSEINIDNENKEKEDELNFDDMEIEDEDILNDEELSTEKNNDELNLDEFSNEDNKDDKLLLKMKT
jgi:hypothetical protein